MDGGAPELHHALARHFAGDPHVRVLVERRDRLRRSGEERRVHDDTLPPGDERRLADDLEGRRFAERRRPVVEANPSTALPREARARADLVRFLRRLEPTSVDHDPVRVAALTLAWRERSRELEREVRTQATRSRAQGIEALSAALAARDDDTWEHSVAVLWLAGQCATEIGLSEPAIADIRDVALLHDIGKLGVPESILRKAGPLSDAEREIVRQHPLVGAHIVQAIESLRHLAPAIQAEHERWDGKGYPYGLAGPQIPLPSRVVFVCDAYHAMVSERPYRQPMDPEAARQELAEHAGSQFSPDCVSALLAVLGDTIDRR